VVAVGSQFEALAQGPEWEDSLELELAKVALFQRVVSQAPALSLQVGGDLVALSSCASFQPVAPAAKILARAAHTEIVLEKLIGNTLQPH
jgi:hypothetical protein